MRRTALRLPADRARVRVTPRGRGTLAAHQRIVLGSEIVGAYVATRWRLGRQNLLTLVADMRATAGHSSATSRLTASAASTYSVETHITAARLANAVTRTLRFLPENDSNCLVKSMVLSALLADRGIHTTLVIGARPSPDFLAHAWVEFAGKPLLPTNGFDNTRLLEI